MNSRRSRFAVAAAVALGLLLTACSGGAGPESSSSAGQAPAATKTVTDSLGTQVTVPVKAQRVVSLHYASTLPMLDLGVTPVGVNETLPNLLAESVVSTVSTLPVVTSKNEPLLEQISLLTPDLILVPDSVKEDVIGRLREIAPTYVISLRPKGAGANTGWQQKEQTLADVLGVPEAAAKRAADFDARKQQIAQTYAAQIKSSTVAAISAYQDNNFYLWGAGSSIGQTLTSLGFAYSPQANATATSGGATEAALSFEKIGGAVSDANLLFVESDMRGTVNAFITALQQTQLYKDVPAVKAGHAYPVGKALVASYTDANYSLDVVERALQGLKQG